MMSKTSTYRNQTTRMKIEHNKKDYSQTHLYRLGYESLSFNLHHKTIIHLLHQRLPLHKVTNLSFNPIHHSS